MPLPRYALFRSFVPQLFGLLLAPCCVSALAAPPAPTKAPSDAAAEPRLPRTLCLGGADMEARLDPWIVDTPADYSGHYVSDSVTDGWVEMRIAIRSAGAHAGAPRWVADVLERDDRRGPRKEEREFRNLPVEEKPQPHIQLEEQGLTLFFIQHKEAEPKGMTLHPALVSPHGDCYRFEPRLPRTIALAGREVAVDLRPWKAPKPAAYDGHYVSITAAEGSASEIDLTAKPHSGSRLSWSLDAAVTYHPPGKEETEYDYTDRPLWEGEWPHFDATEAYAFIYFTDPRTPGAKAAPALITARGNVLVRMAKP